MTCGAGQGRPAAPIDVPPWRDPAAPVRIHAQASVRAAGGYGLQVLRADALAGLTVALPLGMAIAIASGLSPGQGLVSSVVGGFLVSLLGGSRHQIGGPAGAFIVLVAATVTQFGVKRARGGGVHRRRPSGDCAGAARAWDLRAGGAVQRDGGGGRGGGAGAGITVDQTRDPPA